MPTHRNPGALSNWERLALHLANFTDGFNRIADIAQWHLFLGEQAQYFSNFARWYCAHSLFHNLRIMFAEPIEQISNFLKAKEQGDIPPEQFMNHMRNLRARIAFIKQA